ncbi:MAG: DNA/RNA non-specific endonuclease, partial [Fimbriimonadaceae bacterium]|nr:DNA/RNA non-specific endonuclease [Fimbriimonadaceae bacterium]
MCPDRRYPLLHLIYISHETDDRTEDHCCEVYLLTAPKADIGTGTAPTGAARKAAQTTLGQSGDDAGHIIARILGGRGGVKSGNIAGILPKVNRGQMASLEKQIAAQVR